LKKALTILLGLFSALAMIQRSPVIWRLGHCAPLAPLVTPLDSLVKRLFDYDGRYTVDERNKTVQRNKSL